jgi:hypothetical protein
MTSTPARARYLAALVATLLCACDSSDSRSAVSVHPPEAVVPLLGQAAFAATAPAVTWRVAEGAAGGEISPDGVYRAPGSTGRFTVVAVEPISGATGSATVAVVAPSGTTATHGLAIPSGHPRLWFDAERLARARAWYRNNPFTPSEWRGLQWASFALRGLLNDEPAQCQTAVNWALSFTPTAPFYDQLRWYGQDVALIFDWCYSTFTPAQRTALISKWNGLFTTNMNYSWAATGGVTGTRSGPFGNYYWGVLRGDLLWALATYDENPAAESFLDDALGARYAGEFVPASRTTQRGGVATDSSHYGPYTREYATIAFETARLFGRDLWAETPWWQESVFAIIYGTAPTQSTQVHGGAAASSWDYFPFGDEESWNTSSSNGGNQAKLSTLGNFMTIEAARWAAVDTGRYASQWLATVMPQVDQHVSAVTPSLPAPRSFASLPLDYHAAGPSYLYGHSSSDWAAGTAFALHLGYGAVEGHVHDDFGSWQLWRGGRWISRETTEYSQSIAGYAGGSAVGVISPVAHNSLLVGGVGPSHGRALAGTGLPSTTRLQSATGFTFASVDLSATYPSAATRVVRDFVFVRDLETLVVFDRIQADGGGRTRSFLAHCENAWTAVDGQRRACTTGSQALALTTLVPAAPTYRVVVEGGAYGQHRLEVDDAPGTTQSYMLHVLQAKPSSAASLSASVSDDGSSYTVSLDATHSITFAKGMASSGGSITLGGVTRALREDVQPMRVTDAGPVWQ